MKNKIAFFTVLLLITAPALGMHKKHIKNKKLNIATLNIAIEGIGLLDNMPKEPLSPKSLNKKQEKKFNTGKKYNPNKRLSRSDDIENINFIKEKTQKKLTDEALLAKEELNKETLREIYSKNNSLEFSDEECHQIEGYDSQAGYFAGEESDGSIESNSDSE
ncbi:MAG: hypothetical protein UR12_C0023G0010 [candidate division TM6 bacterium GW2011_GWF2_30_66]|jgi:hypothetical protein|nr:MAG: hypothetical protein UR12_C0023G0010 [candidate division TM6 bacterium GW2011_GWF2_30_66]